MVVKGFLETIKFLLCLISKLRMLAIRLLEFKKKIRSFFGPSYVIVILRFFDKKTAFPLLMPPRQRFVPVRQFESVVMPSKKVALLHNKLATPFLSKAY